MDPKWSPRSWERLGAHVTLAREELGLTQTELAAVAGVSIRTVQTFERGAYRVRLPIRARSIEEALGWHPGSVERILQGGEPTRMTKLDRMTKREKEACRKFLLDAPMPAGTRASLLRVLEQLDSGRSSERPRR